LHTTSPLGPNGLPVYTASDYTFALSVIPIGVSIGILLSFFLKETHCRSVAKESHERIFASKSILLKPEVEGAT
jgi:hypothetical protein